MLFFVFLFTIIISGTAAASSGDDSSADEIDIQEVDQNLITNTDIPDPRVVRGGSVVYTSTTIQDAINHAQDGDTIEVDPGTYTENIIVNHQLTIIATGSAASTIVQAADPSAPVFTINTAGSGSTIQGFTILNDISGMGFSAGILLDESDNNTIIGNTLIDNWYNIRAQNSNNNHLINNDISNPNWGGAAWGISLENSNQNEIKGNNIHQCVYGIDGVFGSNGNTISENIINNNSRCGINLYGSDNTIEDNKINYNGFDIMNPGPGIGLYNSTLTTIRNNELKGNQYGLILEDSSNNTVYRNQFIANTDQISVTGTSTNNTFNLDAPTGGNYWSDYTGQDRGDGFGNIPYTLTGGQDNLPLIGTGTIYNVYPGQVIQTVIDTATNGDTILIHGDSGNPATYTENIIVNKQLIIKPAYDGTITLRGVNTDQPVFLIDILGSGSTIQGLIIDGATGNSAGIWIEDSSVQIINNTITNHYSDGINIIGGSGSIITGNTITNSGTADGSVAAITLWETINNQIINNTIIEGGINLWGSTENQNTGNLIQYNDISGHMNGPAQTQGYGIKLNGADNNKIINNHIHHNQGSGIYCDNANNNTLNENYIYDNNLGIKITASNDNTIENNNIHDNTIEGILIEADINDETGEITPSINNNIDGNTIYNNDIGIKIINSDSNQLGQRGPNILTNNTSYGILLDNSPNTSMQPNTITGSNIGLAIYNNSNETFVDTFTINTTAYGIHIQNSNGNIIVSSIISNNSILGLFIQNSSDNTISGNTIQSNGWVGVCLDNSDTNTIDFGNEISSNGEGIYIVNNSNGNTITENNIHHNFSAGINILNGSNNNIISDNMIMTNGVIGILIRDSDTNTITKNDIGINGWAGLALDYADGNTINGINIITGNQEGINLMHSTENIIDGNSISGNSNIGISIISSSNSNYITNNTSISYNGIIGVYLRDSATNTVSGNSIQGNSWVGICFDNATGNIINNNNNISGNLEGLYIVNNSNNNAINNNNIHENQDTGIYIDGSTENQISGNTAISNNGVIGILLRNANSNNINYNTINGNNFAGIALDNADSNFITGSNTVSGCQMGIYIVNTSNGTTIYNNTLQNNTWAGLVIDSATNTIIYQNNFNNNPLQALAQNGSGNAFYQGTVGNYWSDWPSTEPRLIYGNENLYDEHPSITPF